MNLRVKLLRSSSVFAHLCCICFIIFFILQKSTAQTATTDPAEVKALNAVFQEWGVQAPAGLWNISGEPCTGSAINGTKLEDHPVAITCNCSFNNNSTCHVTQLYAFFLFAKSRKFSYGVVSILLEYRQESICTGQHRSYSRRLRNFAISDVYV
ncbi:hypothetical protein Patl1_11738 [Pistacia atlantica]|uniref:Uncharacterized protein n=1 Tax=Pistacia atlantica TaxID=434234 RepID=A0ACC1A1V3_9ROSI|nr:hypothetical protein Patl1_11738 [Pistacia atlantica]